MPSARSLALLCRWTGASIREEEVATLVTGFWGFFSILAGYFLLLPLRDEAGVSLGTHNLPKLFAASLLLTLLATPLASFFINRHPARECGLRQLYHALSLLVLVFCGLYLLTGAPTQQLRTPPAAAGQGTETAVAARDLLEPGGGGGPGLRLHANLSDGTGLAKVAALAGQHGQLRQQRQLHAAAEPTVDVAAAAAAKHPLQERPAAAAGARPGAAVLSPAQRAVRVAFFLSASLLNLVAVSSWWARAADVFPAEAAARLFGILGAGATLGQLVGSVTAGALARTPLLRASPTSPSLLPLLLSAAMLALASECAARFHVLAPPLPSRVSARGYPAPAAAPSGRPVLQEAGGALAQGDGAASSGGKQQQQQQPLRSGSSRACGAAAAAGGSSWRQTLAATSEGFNLIVRSSYLRHLCLFLVLNYVVSSFFYFEKALVVAAAVNDAASRTAWFAYVNSASAFCILGLQLLATGPVLHFLGVSRALAITPAAAGLLMARVALNPTPSSVGAAEVVRKVLTYSLARPAREVLFTVVSREEKYKAKIFVDTVVQRCGDVLAAGAFQALDGALGLGQAGVAAAAVPVCAAWAGVGLALGRRQEALAAGAARKLLEAVGEA